MRIAVVGCLAEHGADRARAFARFYLGPRQTVLLAEACALPTLSPEVMRADTETRGAYKKELHAIIEEVAAGLPGAGMAAREEKAIAMLATLAGGAMPGRAVADSELAARIHRAVERHAVR